MSRVAGETGISSKAQSPERQREEGKEQQTGTSQITPTLPWVPTEYQPENFPRPGVGLEVEIGFTSWAALRALTIVASPKWLWIPAQLSRAQPGFGLRSWRRAAKLGGARRLGLTSCDPSKLDPPLQRRLGHRAGTLSPRSPVPPHPPAPPRPLGASSGGQTKRSRPAAPGLRRRLQGADSVAAWTPRSPHPARLLQPSPPPSLLPGQGPTAPYRKEGMGVRD